MNYDEAIKALESRYAGYGDKGELVLAYDSKQIATIKSALETAKKEHELMNNIQATILSCIDLLGKSGENTKAIVAEKLKGLVE